MPTTARQFDVFRLRRAGLVVILDSDLLDTGSTRVVVPLVVTRAPYTAINPNVEVNGADYTLLVQQIGALPVRELVERVGNLGHERDRVIRAVDALLSGF